MKNNTGIVVGTVIAVMFAALMIAGLLNTMNRSEVGPCTVTKKEAVMVEGSNQYRVYTEECGVFIVKDTLVPLRFNSADTYSALKEGTSYNLRTQGFRLGITSSFPNILNYEPVVSG